MGFQDGNRLDKGLLHQPSFVAAVGRNHLERLLLSKGQLNVEAAAGGCRSGPRMDRVACWLYFLPLSFRHQYVDSTDFRCSVIFRRHHPVFGFSLGNGSLAPCVLLHTAFNASTTIYYGSYNRVADTGSYVAEMVAAFLLAAILFRVTAKRNGRQRDHSPQLS
jgi:hypothetical protein